MASGTRQARSKRNATRGTSSQTSSNTSKGNGSGNIVIPEVKDFRQEPVVKIDVDSSVSFNDNNQSVKLDLQSLPTIKREDIGKQVKYDQAGNDITDITKPDGIKTVDQKTFESAKTKYEGGIRYRQLEQLYNKYVAEGYKSLVEAYRAYGQGLVAEAELEKVKHKFIDVLKQQQITKDKIIGLVDQAHQTAINEASLPYKAAKRIADLNTLKANTEKAFEQSQQTTAEVADFVKSLGATTTATK